VRTYLLAGIPTSLCPSSVNATVEGVVLIPIDNRWVRKSVEGGPAGWAGLTFGILDDFGVVSFHDRNTGVCGSEIDTNDAA
jgi:hypothetical protein